MEYFIILVFVFLCTLILEKTQKIHLYKSKKERLTTTVVFFFVGTIWDNFAVWRRHWLFPDHKTIGIKIALLPIEEYIFFFVVPYFIITVYLLIHKKQKGKFKLFWKRIFKK